MVASDRTLRDVALQRPRNAASLELCYGIGPARAKRYGTTFLAIVAKHEL